MTPFEMQSIKREYVALAAYYRAQIDDHVLGMYADDLADLPHEATLHAMRSLRREPGRRQHPLPSDIRQRVAPGAGSELAQANDIAGRISAAIGRFGYTNQPHAKSFIGPLGWEVVDRMGGWVNLCTTLTSAQMGTFRAQCRDLARSMLEMGGVGHAEDRPALRPAPAKPCLESVSAVMGRLTLARQG